MLGACVCVCVRSVDITEPTEAASGTYVCNVETLDSHGLIQRQQTSAVLTSLSKTCTHTHTHTDSYTRNKLRFFPHVGMIIFVQRIEHIHTYIRTYIYTYMRARARTHTHRVFRPTLVHLDNTAIYSKQNGH